MKITYEASDAVAAEIPDILDRIVNSIAGHIDEFVPESFLDNPESISKEHWPDGHWPVYSVRVYDKNLVIFPLEHNDGSKVLHLKWEDECDFSLFGRNFSLNN